MAKRRGFMDGYKTYDPEVEGYGSPKAWRAAFQSIMGLDEARQTVGSRTPEEMLGTVVGASWTVILSAFRATLRDCHPDRCTEHGLSYDVATERTKLVIAAYTVLKARFGK